MHMNDEQLDLVRIHTNLKLHGGDIRLGNPGVGLETPRYAWWVGIWAMQNQAS